MTIESVVLKYSPPLSSEAAKEIIDEHYRIVKELSPRQEEGRVNQNDLVESTKTKRKDR